MKRLTIALLMTLACSNAFGMQEETLEVNAQKQVQAKSSIKKDLIKGTLGLAGAGLFGALSYASYLKLNKAAVDYNKYDNYSKTFYNNALRRVLKLLPKDGALKNNLKAYSGIAGNGAIALSCAAYAAYKFGSVIYSKLTAPKAATLEGKLRISNNYTKVPKGATLVAETAPTE